MKVKKDMYLQKVTSILFVFGKYEGTYICSNTRLSEEILFIADRFNASGEWMESIEIDNRPAMMDHE